MTGYGPQEHWHETEKIPFFVALEEEIIKAELHQPRTFWKILNHFRRL